MMEFNLDGRFVVYRLGKVVSKVLSSSEARKEFEEWYEKTYGKEYVWKTKEDYLNKIYNKEVPK